MIHNRSCEWGTCSSLIYSPTFPLLLNCTDACYLSCTLLFNAPLQEVSGTPNPSIGWDPTSPQLIISVLAGDVRMGFRAMRDYCEGMGVAVPTQLQSKVGVVLCAV